MNSHISVGATIILKVDLWNYEHDLLTVEIFCCVLCTNDVTEQLTMRNTKVCCENDT